MASQLPRSQPPLPSALDPRRILDLNYAFASTAMLVAAVRLHLFTHMAHKVLSVSLPTVKVNEKEVPCLDTAEARRS